MAQAGRGARRGAREGTRPGARAGDGPWREAAGTVAVIPDEAGFAMMRRRYRTFRFADHAAYLRHVEALLASLTGRQGYTSVALFDPVDFAEWCERERLDPDSADSRARYAGEIAVHGATVPYEGQPLGRLVPRLLAEHRRWEVWELGTDLLAGAGECPACGAPLPTCAFSRAAGTLRTLLEGAGPGTHHLVCSLAGEDGPLTAALRAQAEEDDGPVRLPEQDALVLCTVLAAALATARPVGLVLRTAPPPGAAAGPGAAERVCGWSVHEGVLRPLGEAEVFAAYCTDALTGEPVPPEPGVSYRDAPSLPQPRCAGAPGPPGE
ncbi:hypothetical protein [Streptomyces sp. 6N223]|uniref:hypothetical protein n=1 Tax=Streptomyces sp. 6N223 TaxID=3457412 RepID=UPI003FD0BF6F